MKLKPKQSKTLAECMDNLREEWKGFLEILYGAMFYGHYVRLVLWTRRCKLKLIDRWIGE